MDYAQDDCLSNGLFTKEQVVLLEVEVEDSRIRRYDQSFYNLASEAITRQLKNHLGAPVNVSLDIKNDQTKDYA